MYCLTLSLFLSWSWLAAALPQVTEGRLTRWANFPSAHMGAMTVDIWLPDGLDPEARYPVIYMHDGQMLFDADQTWNGQAWEVDAVLGQAVNAGVLPPAVVVGIHNSGANRWGDYFPAAVWRALPKAFVEGMASGVETPVRYHAPAGMRADAYLKFIVEELMPAVRQAFPVDGAPERTAIMGSSMGGLISLYALCEYPEIFGRAACLSTHWIGMTPMDNNPIPDAFVSYLKDNLPPAGGNRIYFDHGTETLDVHYGVWQVKVDEVMRSKGYQESDWVTRVFEGTDHSEAAWSARLLVPLTFLLKG
jgi:enterochelin esterase-like enzyme